MFLYSPVFEMSWPYIPLAISHFKCALVLRAAVAKPTPIQEEPIWLVFLGMRVDDTC